MYFGGLVAGASDVFHRARRRFPLARAGVELEGRLKIRFCGCILALARLALGFPCENQQFTCACRLALSCFHFRSYTYPRIPHSLPFL